VKISQLEHGGNGVSVSVVNQWLPQISLGSTGLPGVIAASPAKDVRFSLRLSRFQTICCSKSSLGPDIRVRPRNLFDCAARWPFGGLQGRKGNFAMIETVTAVMGLVSAVIFLAHALEGYRSRA
jgi:hypothetical protein